MLFCQNVTREKLREALLSEKRARKTLMKLTASTYVDARSLVQSFSPIKLSPTLPVNTTRIYAQLLCIMLCTRCQFHQCFPHVFFVQNFWRQNFKPKSQFCVAFGAKILSKNAPINVDEIDFRCQFHQHFTRSFYTRRSRKLKKYS